MNITGLNKDEVLAALYNGTRQQGMGLMNTRGQQSMSVEDACKILDDRQDKGAGLYFDYLHGRVMKIDLEEDEVDTWLYNRDNGEGAAEASIAHLSGKSEV